MKLLTEVPPQTPITLLTDREREVMRLLAKGLNNMGISDELCCSTHTVKNHKENIKMKLNLTSCQEVLRIAIQYGNDW